MDKPSVGRIVHFVQKNSPEHVPGVICYVHKDGSTINIGCWDPRGNPTSGIDGVREDQTGATPLTWHWPERSK